MDLTARAENSPPGGYALQPDTSQAAGRKALPAMYRQTVGNGGTQSHRG